MKRASGHRTAVRRAENGHGTDGMIGPRPVSAFANFPPISTSTRRSTSAQTCPLSGGKDGPCRDSTSARLNALLVLRIETGLVVSLLRRHACRIGTSIAADGNSPPIEGPTAPHMPSRGQAWL